LETIEGPELPISSVTSLTNLGGLSGLGVLSHCEAYGRSSRRCEWPLKYENKWKKDKSGVSKEEVEREERVEARSAVVVLAGFFPMEFIFDFSVGERPLGLNVIAVIRLQLLFSTCSLHAFLLFALL